MAATLADLNTAIANDDALESSLEAAIAANTTELQALSTQVAPDLQPQVDKILARQAALTTAISTLQASDAAAGSAPADPANTPPPVVPATDPPSTPPAS